MGTESYTQNCKAKVGVSVSQKVGERVAVERVKPARVLTIFLVARIAREVAAHDGVGTLESTVLVIVQANEDLKAFASMVKPEVSACHPIVDQDRVWRVTAARRE